MMADEQQIVPVETPDAEPKIAFDESAGKEPATDAVPEERAAAESKPKAGCPIAMGFMQVRCGRKLHAAPGRVDEQPVCLMHSKDEGKESGPLFEEFWRVFEEILEEAGEGEAHFEDFVFPEANLSKRTFKAICRFLGAIFTQNAVFYRATFTQDAIFYKAKFARDADFRDAVFTQKDNFVMATFAQGADFSKATFSMHAIFGEATFKQNALFNDAAFSKDADFRESTFTQNAYFVEATFTQSTDFSRATFSKDAIFGEATFTQNADFSNATFTQKANFEYTKFKGNADFAQAAFTQDANFVESSFAQFADFTGTTFTRNASFSAATFTQDADFLGSTFNENADFSAATFLRNVSFEQATFCGAANWRSCRYLDQAEFRRTAFKPKIENTPSAIFVLAKFAKPEEVVFDGVDLSRALFLNCDASGFWFTSSVQWAKRKGNRGLAVFEEQVLLNPSLSEIHRGYGPIDHGAVEQIYHQLKKNYDSRLDYRKANDFHFGEMEMRRLEARTYPALLKPWGWMRPWLGPEALYRWASNYGNGYVKPMLWLLGFLLLFALLFPIPGLEIRQPIVTPAKTYTSVWNRQDKWTNNVWTEAKLLGKSAIAAVDTATFQRNSEVHPGLSLGPRPRHPRNPAHFHALRPLPARHPPPIPAIRATTPGRSAPDP